MDVCSGSTSHRKIKKEESKHINPALFVIIKHRCLKAPRGYLIICIGIFIYRYRQI